MLEDTNPKNLSGNFSIDLNTNVQTNYEALLQALKSEIAIKEKEEIIADEDTKENAIDKIKDLIKDKQRKVVEDIYTYKSLTNELNQINQSLNEFLIQNNNKQDNDKQKLLIKDDIKIQDEINIKIKDKQAKIEDKVKKIKDKVKKIKDKVKKIKDKVKKIKDKVKKIKQYKEAIAEPYKQNLSYYKEVLSAIKNNTLLEKIETQHFAKKQPQFRVKNAGEINIFTMEGLAGIKSGQDLKIKDTELETLNGYAKNCDDAPANELMDKIIKKQNSRQNSQEKYKTIKIIIVQVSQKEYDELLKLRKAVKDNPNEEQAQKTLNNFYKEIQLKEKINEAMQKASAQAQNHIGSQLQR